MNILFLVLGFCILISGCLSESIDHKLIDNSSSLKCFENNTLKIKGNSMFPLIKNGEEVIFLKNYYNCNQIQRDDIIIFNFSANNQYLIKSIKAIPDDSFVYSEGFIYINDNKLKNFQNNYYNIDSKLLELYAKNFPKIPESHYLILGEITGGSLDSSKFIFVNKKDIIGKIELLE